MAFPLGKRDGIGSSREIPWDVKGMYWDMYDTMAIDNVSCLAEKNLMGKGRYKTYHRMGI